MLLTTTNAVAVEHSDSVTTTRKRSVVTRFLDYFNDANKGKKKRGIDFSIIGGPHYSTDTKLGIGLVASGTVPFSPTRQPAATKQHIRVQRLLNRGFLHDWHTWHTYIPG